MPLTKSWMYPCNVYDMSAFCWHWILGQGLLQQGHSDDDPMGKRTDLTRFLALRSLPYMVTDLCYRQDMKESNRLGCVFGMSSVYFLLYHEGWVAARSGASPLDACLQIPTFTVNAPSEACNLLFNHSSSVPVSLGGQSSLMDWCTLFVSQDSQIMLSTLDERRWLSCAVGSSWMTLPIIAVKVGLKAAYALCDHVAPWQSGLIWKEMEMACLSRLGLSADILQSDSIRSIKEWIQLRRYDSVLSMILTDEFTQKSSDS